MNLSLLYFSFDLFRPFTQRQADALHQPNTTETFHKHVLHFSIARVLFIPLPMTLMDLVHSRHGGQMLMLKHSPFVQILDVNQCKQQLISMLNKKIRDHQHLYDPFNNHYDCLKLLIRQVIKYNALRGAGEVRLVCFLFYFI
jgi:hypothetical protein